MISRRACTDSFHSNLVSFDTHQKTNRKASAVREHEARLCNRVQARARIASPSVYWKNEIIRNYRVHTIKTSLSPSTEVIDGGSNSNPAD